MTETSIISELTDYPSIMIGSDQREAFLLIRRLSKRFGFSDAMSTLMAHLMLRQEPMTIEDLVAETRLGRTSVSTTLGALESRFLVIKEKRGRIGYYTPNVDFGKLIADQPVKVLQEEIKPLISLLEKSYKTTESKRQQKRYRMLLGQLRDSSSTLEKIIKCLQANG
jgi:DNA-binding transcriptional regulator GbsR (MarR family)